jgi:hypothetical protein
VPLNPYETQKADVGTGGSLQADEQIRFPRFRARSLGFMCPELAVDGVATIAGWRAGGHDHVVGGSQ